MKIKVQQTSEVDNLKVNFLGSGIEIAHKDYLKRKNEIITKLYTIWRNHETSEVYRKWIQQAVRFINESDMK